MGFELILKGLVEFHQVGGGRRALETLEIEDI